MSVSFRLQELRTGFNATFWIANTLELFERLAFYGSTAILTKLLLEKVGLKNDAGTFVGVFSGVIYALPVVTGVFVDRYGFKKTLMSCFSVFTVGYFLIALAGLGFGQELVNSVGRKGYVMFALLLTAVGGSLIKPCIVGTVAKSSKPNVKSLGFSIYYTLVNLGGAIGPVIAHTVRQDFGIEYVLIMSSVTSLLLLVGTFFFFKEPEAEAGEEKRTFEKVFRDMLMVFSNFRFILFLIIFSGFWLMFWQLYLSFPFYVTDVLDYPDFEFMLTIDACCIIFLTVPMATLVKRWKPITAMTLGFLIASFSWIIIGIYGTITASIIGIGLFALGEAIQAPRFYEYVSSLAPKDRIGTYMGFAFLPVAIGSFTAGPIADWLRLSYLQTNPSMMWFTVSGFGIASTILMLLYNMFISKKSDQSH